MSLVCSLVPVKNITSVLGELDAILTEYPHTIHQYSDWYLKYSKHLSDLEKLRILQVRSQEGRLLGALPLEISYKRGTRYWSHRELTILATGPTDFYCLPIIASYADCASHAIAQWLKQHWREWDFLNIILIPADTEIWQTFCQALRDVGLDPAVNLEHGYYEIDTTQAWESYFEEYLQVYNKDLFKSMRRIERDGKRVQVQTIRDNITDTLPHLLPIYAERRKSNNQSNKYEADNHWRFINDVIQSYEKNQRVELNVLKDSENNVWAYQLDWLDKGVRYHYQHAYNEKYSRYSPGKVLLYEIMKNSFTDPEINTCNYMRGEAPYKKNLANMRKQYVYIKVVNPHSIRLHATKYASQLVNFRNLVIPF